MKGQPHCRRGSGTVLAKWSLWIFLLGAFWGYSEVEAQDAGSKNPIIPGIKAQAPPLIDGSLDDPCWKEASAVSGFFREGKPATEETRVRFSYGADALYIAFECRDREPKNIRAQQTKRNGDMEPDDRISLGISPLCDRQTYYWFTVNARGTQGEEIPGGSASKVEWRGDWRAATKIHHQGWSAEMEIPFSFLKYPRGQKRVGICLTRHLAHNDEYNNWPYGTHYYTHENEAYWQNLEMPRHQPRPLLMPYTLWGTGGLQNSAGLDMKYVAENNITALLTYKPDFQTIEDAVQTIDFTYNQRYQEERRPFFMEGGWTFGDDMMFYSRAIEQVDLGVKAYGKQKKLSFGAMEVNHSSGTNAALMNLDYEITRMGGVNLAVVDHRDKGLSNTVYKFGTGWRQPDKLNNYYYGFAVRGSQTNGASSQPALSAYVDHFTGWGVLGWHIFYDDLPADYDATLAFLPEKGFRKVGGWLEYGRETAKGPLMRYGLNMGYETAHHRGGGLFHEGLYPAYWVDFHNQMSANIGYAYQNRPPFRDRITDLGFRWNTRDIYRSGGLYYRFGSQAGGRYRYLSLRQGLRLTARLSFQLNAEILKLDYPGGAKDRYNQTYLSGIYEISSERSLATRLIMRSGKTNLYTAYRQELRRGADIFVVWGDPNADNTVSRIGVKVVNTY